MKLVGDSQEDEIARLRAWIDDLQSGMYVNCVYCGHRYGPGETTPVSMADALKAHIEICQEHPLSVTRAALRDVLRVLDKPQRTEFINQTGYEEALRVYETARALVPEL